MEESVGKGYRRERFIGHSRDRDGDKWMIEVGSFTLESGNRSVGV